MDNCTVKHISEFYPISSVNLGSELYYICELGKYLSTYNCKLSLDGVVLHRVLRKSRFWDYFRIAIYNEWLCDVSVSLAETEITEQNPVNLETVVNRRFVEREVGYVEAGYVEGIEDYTIFAKPSLQTIVFDSKDADTWVWKHGSSVDIEVVHTKAFGGTSYKSQLLVSLVAYVAVERFMNNTFKTFKLEIPSVFCMDSFGVSDLVLLEERTNAIDWVETTYKVDDSKLDNIGYEAWLYRGREIGYKKREYSPKEKIAEIKRVNFAEGDIVSFYERRMTQKNNAIKTIEDFHFAIIRKIDAKGITLDLICTRKTKYGAKREFDQLTTAVKDMFGGRYVDKGMKFSSKTLSWYEIGVNYLLDEEQFFITSLQGDDFIELLVHDGRQERMLKMNEFDYIYWLLRDYGIEFNDEKFLTTYFPKEDPLYMKLVCV